MSAKARPERTAQQKKRNGFWKKQARIWHWMSGAVCLTGMVMFAFTGITLNHAGDIPAKPKTSAHMASLPTELLSDLSPTETTPDDAPLPRSVRQFIRANLGVSVGTRAGEWTDFDVYVPLPRPGGDAWLAIDRESGAIEYERTSRGSLSYLNDLHKGRNTGLVWAIFLDVFSVATMLFCLTGLWLLQIHAGKRSTTWPLTIAGLLIPAALALFFIH